MIMSYPCEIKEGGLIYTMSKKLNGDVITEVYTPNGERINNIIRTEFVDGVDELRVLKIEVFCRLVEHKDIEKLQANK